MIVGSSMHAASGFLNSKVGFEYPAVLGWGGAALALTGPGAVSLDYVLGHRFNRSWMRNLALVAAAPAALAIIAERPSAVAAETPPAQTPPAQAPATQAPAAQPDPTLEEASSR